MNDRSPSYQHYLDASYEAWRSGVNPDRINMDRCYGDYAEGRSPQDTVRDIQRRDHEARRQRENEQAEYEEAEEYARRQYEAAFPEPRVHIDKHGRRWVKP